jgi:tetratricopeptide (TPR) repeat protein
VNSLASNAYGAGHTALGAVENVVSGSTVSGNVFQAQTIGSVTVNLPGPPVGKPSQLPPVARHFVNRKQELGILSRLADEAVTDRGPAVAVMTGLAGVGKTATCVWWGHQHRHEFDGGQLYADFAEYQHRGAVNVSDILGAFLRALGVYDHYLPADLSERTAMFRTRTSARRMLIMLDNVQQPAQVRPLLPGAGPSVVLVTSRRRLSGLLGDGALLVSLKPFDKADGSLVVSSFLAACRRSADPAALADLVKLCGGLPIALRVAATRLAERNRWSPAELVSYLADEQHRLSRLSVQDDHAVQSVFDVAYADLPRPVRELYHLLGVHPGPDLDPFAAAAGMNIEFDRADELLGVLGEASLVEEQHGNRYRPHDLVRLHARQCAEDALSTEQRARIAHRIVTWYLRCASAADIAVMGRGRWRLAEQDVSSVPFDFDAKAGMQWLEGERANLLAVVRLASTYDWHDMVWQLCEALWALYYSKKLYGDWVETSGLGVTAAQLVGHKVAEARMRNFLARAQIELHEFGRAEESLTAARAVATGSADKRAQAAVTESFGVLHREQGRYPQAAEEFRRALQCNKIIGDQRGIALQAYHLAGVLVRDGHAEAALKSLDQAADIFGRLDDHLAQVRSDIVRGQALQALGRTDEAIRTLRLAADTTRGLGQTVKEIQALEALLEVIPEDSATAARLSDLYRVAGLSSRGA